jgi:ubiquitin-conjugating enzyme E2 J2
MTPNGRFQPNQRICTSFSDYHPELWDPSWNVETIVLGLISFWLSPENTAGAIKTSDEEKVRLARESLKYNFSKGPRF